MSDISTKALSEAELLKEIYKKLAGETPALDLNKALSKAQLLRGIAEVAKPIPVPVSSDPVIPNIKVATGSIPAINPGSRSVIEVNLGTLNNPKKALIAFFSIFSESNHLINGTINDSSMVLKYTNSNNISIRTVFPQLPPANVGMQNHLTAFYVTEDYTKATRHISVGTRESYLNSSSVITTLPGGYTYESINAGVLVGFYSLNNTGAFTTDKKIICESMWLTQSGNNTILNIAFKNQDSSVNTVLDFKLAIYE